MLKLSLIASKDLTTSSMWPKEAFDLWCKEKFSNSIAKRIWKIEEFQKLFLIQLCYSGGRGGGATHWAWGRPITLYPSTGWICSCIYKVSVHSLVSQTLAIRFVALIKFITLSCSSNYFVSARNLSFLQTGRSKDKDPFLQSRGTQLPKS